MGSNGPVKNESMMKFISRGHAIHRDVTGSNPVEVLNFSGLSTQL